MIRKACFVLVLVALTACAAKPVWVKPGATPADFGADKYACLQGSLASAPAVAGTSAYAQSSTNAYNSNGTFSVKTHDINAGTRDQMFAACMQSKGWSLEQPVQATNSAASPPLDTNKVQQTHAYCENLFANPALDPIRSVIAIGSAPTLEQQNNPDHIRNDQKPALDVYKAALEDCRNNMAKVNPHVWKLFVQADPKSNESLKLLYEKKITIGEYNTQKEAVIEKIQSEVSSQIQ